MHNTNQIEEQINSYRYSEYNWEKQLFLLYDEYFKKEFLELLLHLGFSKSQTEEIFLQHLLVIISKVLRPNSEYFGKEPFTLPSAFSVLQHPSFKKESTLNVDNAKNLFSTITISDRMYFIKLLEKEIKVNELKGDKINLAKDNDELILQNKKLAGANEVLQKVLEDRQEEKRKNIDNMAQSYIIACESYKTDRPTLIMLSKLSDISQNIWKKQLTNSAFLYVLLKKIESKKKLAKNTAPFWIGAYSFVEQKLSKALKDDKVKNKSYNDDVNYKRESGKKNKSNLSSDYD